MKLADVLEGVSLISCRSQVRRRRRNQRPRLRFAESRAGLFYSLLSRGARPMAASSQRKLWKKALSRSSAKRPPRRTSAVLGFSAAHGRQALATASGNFYNHPDRRLKIIGVTGTNGKTTTTYLIDSILRAAGLTTALVGTIEYRLAGRRLPSINTTPESLDLFEMFSELERLGGTHVTMETSSHALSLGRVYGVQFETAVFTNLTRDHLDFHGDMDSYLAAKQMLFTSEASAGPRFAVINHDDSYASAIRTKPQTEVITYGMGEGASARAQSVATDFDGLRFEIHHDGRTYKVESPLVGQINVYNLLAAWCAAYSVGIGPEVIARGIADCGAVPGRFERVTMGSRFSSLSITRTPTTPCAISSRSRAASRASASSRSSAAEATATAPSVR